MKKRSLIIIASVILLIVVAVIILCFVIPKKEEEKKIKPIKQVEPQIEEKKVNIVDVNSNTRSYAVVINNFPSAVKVQTGLQDAYMIYEIPVEGGMTRSLAFYKDKTTEKIGTVRSARHNFLDYVLENDAIFVHFGWSHYAQEQIPSLGINNINGLYDAPFWRENPEGLATEHTAYTSLVKAKKDAKNKGYSQTTKKELLLNYSTNEIKLNELDGAVVANNVTFNYSYSYNVKFTYNANEGKYYRYVNGVAHKDYFTGEHYNTKNIIVVKLSYTSAADNYYLDIKTVGSGEGYFITNGYSVPITWEKKSRSSQTTYKYKNGDEIIVNDGNTYIMLHSKSEKTIIG